MSTQYTDRKVVTNDSDITTIFNDKAILDWVSVSYVSSADVGNRQLELRVVDAAVSPNTLYAVAAGAVQAAGATRRYTFMPGVGREAAFVSNGITVPMPAMVIPAGGGFQIIDSAAIAAAADDMVITWGYRSPD